jgi:hypothetical protein
MFPMESIACGSIWGSRVVRGGLAAILCVWYGRCGGAEEPPAPSADKVMVGAYYYPWYAGARSKWDAHAPRLRLDPPQLPAAGRYDSSDADLIARHIAQSQRGGIDFWAVSWWGPRSTTDRIIRRNILGHEQAGALKYAVLYEAQGRFRGLRNPDFSRWEGDLRHLREHYFQDPNYLKIDGRPVLIVYLTRALFKREDAEPLRILREKFPEVYLVGDEVFGPGYRADRAKWFDAITAYDVYGQSAKRHGSNRKAVEVLAKSYAEARRAAKAAGKGFIPVVAPGYNDTQVRRGNEPAPRYFAEEKGSQDGDMFRAMIETAALPNLDASTGNMMLVTSFNEWWEDTQIEPTAGTAGTTTKDQSRTTQEVTRGMRYEDYGYKYLDLLREMVGAWNPAK